MIVVDTHVVIWLLTAPEKISKRAAAAIAADGRLGVLPVLSAATLYELTYAQQRNRMRVLVAEEEFYRGIRAWFRTLEVSEEIALAAGRLAPFHGDPMDRMIAATAMVHKCPLITADRRIHEAKVCTAIW